MVCCSTGHVQSFRRAPGMPLLSNVNEFCVCNLHHAAHALAHIAKRVTVMSGTPRKLLCARHCLPCATQWHRLATPQQRHRECSAERNR